MAISIGVQCLVPLYTDRFTQTIKRNIKAICALDFNIVLYIDVLGHKLLLKFEFLRL